MPAQSDIDTIWERLAQHRATLAYLLSQLAIHSTAYAPPAVVAGIREARAGIAHCKAALRGWGVAVEDLPDDQAPADSSFGGAAASRPSARGAATLPEAPAPAQAEYAASFFEVASGWAGLAVFAILGLAWLGRGVGLALGLVSGAGADGMTLAGAVALALGAAAGWSAYRAMRQRVRILTDGLEIVEGRQVEACRWDDIEAIWYATSMHRPPRSLPRSGQTPDPPGPRYVSSGYRLSLADGRTLSVPMGLRSHQELIRTIEGQVLARRLPRCRAQYRAQGEVAFGTAIRVTTRGVQLRKDLIPWGRVSSAGSDTTTVWVQCADEAGRRRIPLSAQTPNPFVFSALVNEIVGAAGVVGSPR